MLKKNLPLIIGSIAAIILAIGIFSFSKPDLNFDKNTSQTTSNSSQKTTSDNSKSETTVNQSSSNNSTDSKSQVLSNSELAKFDEKTATNAILATKIRFMTLTIPSFGIMEFTLQLDLRLNAVRTTPNS